MDRTPTERDRRLTDRGVMLTFTDAHGTTHTVAESTRDRLTVALTGRTAGPGPVVVGRGQGHPDLHGVVTFADGTTVTCDGTVAADTPFGYGTLTGPDGTRTVAVVPDRMPAAPSGWGWAVQLYAARSDTSWGIGDFADLAWLTGAAAADGATAVLVSPLHAAHPRYPADSPYAPASREWLNLLHIAVEQVPGADRVDLSDLARCARALNDTWLIDRDRVWRYKREALERIWAAVRDDLPADFTRFLYAGGTALETFCAWSVLADTHDGWWVSWPEQYRRADSPAVAALAAEQRDAMRFWAWCQWVADTQLADACGRGVDVVFDLAVGFDGGGCDGWRYQDLLAFDFEVGAPPDRRNLEGQRWGLPPFDPAALRAAGYEPWLATVRAALRHAQGVRMDHVMALWRLFWVPAAGGPAEGAYVRYPAEDLLGLLRLEATRAGAWVVGEDMGTVEDGVRETMATIGMLGYRVATRVAPEDFPAPVMASAETHDQPTVAGIVSGDDRNLCRLVGKAIDEAKLADLRTDLVGRGGYGPDVPLGVEETAAVIRGVYRDVAASKAQLVLATLEDVTMASARPNIPNIVDTYPCWRIPLRSRLAVAYRSPLARSVAEEFRTARGPR